MTLIKPEISPDLSDYNHLLMLSDYESLSPKLRQEWELLRRTYMDENMDWHVKDDRDRYDADPATLQLLMLNSKGGISAGMRLTPCSSIEKTLSWGMLPDITIEHARGIDGPVWDLTRLVPGNNIGKSDSMSAFAELFGAALARTQEIDSNPRWIFATHLSFVRAFQRNGIEFTVIPDTERNGNALCYAFPVQRTKFLIDKQDDFQIAHDSVMRGIQRVNSGWGINGSDIS